MEREDIEIQLENIVKQTTKEEKEFKEFLQTHRKKYEHKIMLVPNMENFKKLKFENDKIQKY